MVSSAKVKSGMTVNLGLSLEHDFTLIVQVGEHPRLRDYNQSFVPTPESWKVGYYFLAVDDIV